MTHPEELLAGYVDGTLSAAERAAAEAHIASCARCRREVALATSARSALGSLTEVPAPSGVADRALQEAAGSPQRQAVGTPRWYRIAGVAAAAAAALLVVAVALPHIGTSPSSTSDARGAVSKAVAGGALPPTAQASPAAIEIQQTNYDNASLSDLSASFARQDAALSTPPTAGAAESTAVISGTPAQTAKALACLVKSAPSEAGQPTRLISARFQGTPAYLEVFLEGPGADQPPDSVVVWVFATKDCTILSFSQARL